MILIEIESNANCEPTERVFHEVEPPRPVARVRLERTVSHPAWYDITGWTAEGAPCPALACKVDDSGDGVAYLLCGGSAGLRLRPTRSSQQWGMDEMEWGEPFILTADAGDLEWSSTG